MVKCANVVIEWLHKQLNEQALQPIGITKREVPKMNIGTHVSPHREDLDLHKRNAGISPYHGSATVTSLGSASRSTVTASKPSPVPNTAFTLPLSKPANVKSNYF
jgi:hypothetical protein